MNAAELTALATLLGLVGTGAAWWLRRRDAKADPLPRHAAEVAISKEALGIVQASAAMLEADVQRLRSDREADRLRIDALETSVRSMRQTWGAWYRDLVDRWHVHREQSGPPSPPPLD